MARPRGFHNLADIARFPSPEKEAVPRPPAIVDIRLSPIATLRTRLFNVSLI
jgi:hypothetical protein